MHPNTSAPVTAAYRTGAAATLLLLAAGCAMSEPAPESAPAPSPESPPAASPPVSGASPERPDARPPGQALCDAGPAQRHVGEKATAQLGETILAETGARTLRWGPPRSAWTMDYRMDRVNVRYGDDMAIEAITCG